MRIVSWNVNGLRANARKAFPQFLRESAADVIGVQEVRALPEQLDAETRAPPGWHACFAPGGPGYSGVAIYSRAAPDEVVVGVGERRFDVEGRLITARFGKTFVVNGYFPKGSGSKRDNSRVPYKLDFYMARCS
jgi:exodeoxyribonuclease III